MCGAYRDGRRVRQVVSSRARAVPLHFRQAEVEHFDGAVGFYFDVSRLEIAMDDVFFVGGLERAGNLAGQRQRFVKWKSR